MDRETLEHKGVPHQNGDALGPAELALGDGHVMGGVDHHLHHGRIVLGDARAFLGIGAGAIEPPVDPFRPRHNLKVGDLRV